PEHLVGHDAELANGNPQLLVTHDWNLRGRCWWTLCPVNPGRCSMSGIVRWNSSRGKTDSGATRACARQTGRMDSASLTTDCRLLPVLDVSHLLAAGPPLPECDVTHLFAHAPAPTS